MLAHEIAHVSLDHGIKSIKQSDLTEALTIIGSEAASRSNVQLAHVFGNSVQDIVVTSITNGYSRGQEMEADSTAVDLSPRVRLLAGRASSSTCATTTSTPAASAAITRRRATGWPPSRPPSAVRATPPGTPARTARFKQAVGGAG